MNINYEGIKGSIFALLVLALFIYLFKINSCERLIVSDVNTEIEAINAKNDTLLLSIQELELQVAKKDSIIEVLEKQIAQTDTKVVYIKSKRDEKVNAINSIVPDSLYRLLSGFKY